MSYHPLNISRDDLLKLDPEARHEHILADLKAQYESGDAEALLDAVYHCLDANCTHPRDSKPNLRVPDWVRCGFAEAWSFRWNCGQVRTLGEAFNIERPHNWRQGRARKDSMTLLIWDRVVHHHEKGEPISRDLFEVVAEELTAEGGLKINGTDVQEAYYALTKNRTDSR